MPSDILFDLQQRGHLVRTSALAQVGHSADAVRTAVRRGLLLRPFRGWVATPHASRDAVIALLHRGVLTGPTALRSYGIWGGVDDRIHVLAHPHSKSLDRPLATPLTTFAPTRSLGGVVKRWRMPAAMEPTLTEWRASVIDALVDFSAGQPLEQVVAAIDSALYTRRLRPSDFARLNELLPSRLRGACELANGFAEAGSETLARVRILGMGLRVDVQMWIGPHRVDLLINGWLVVEIDSEEWHGNQRLRDSRRTNWLVSQGYRVLRFDYAEVVGDWPVCELAIREQLRLPPLRPPTIAARRDRRTS